MLVKIFFTILRSVAIPVVAFIGLRNSFLGESGAFLAVAIAVTLINIVSILFGLIKILPNAFLLRGTRVIGLIFSIVIEIVSIIGFWLYYFIVIARSVSL